MQTFDLTGTQELTQEEARSIDGGSVPAVVMVVVVVVAICMVEEEGCLPSDPGTGIFNSGFEG